MYNLTMSKQILVMFSFRSHRLGYIEKLFGRLSERALQKGIVLHRGSLKDLHIEIKNKMSIVEALTGRDVTSFDAVYFELWYKSQQKALATALTLDRSKIPFFSKELVGIMPIDKIGELAVMADNGIPLPHTYISSNRELKKVFKQNPPISFPIIVKAADGYGGKNNYLVKNYAMLKQILDSNKDISFVVQEYVPNDRDYRCLVLGGRIRFVLERRRGSTSHLNNTSAGAEGREVPVDSLPEAARGAVLKAATVLNRDSFAGVDLVMNLQTGDPYILEVNQTPQIEIGAEIERKMDVLLDYMKEMSS